MRVCRTCRLIAAIGGLLLAVIFGTSEAIASTTEIDIVSGFRTWMITLILIAVISVCTALIVERQERIIDRLDTLAATGGAKHDARAELAALQRRLRTDNNITTLHPQE